MAFESLVEDKLNDLLQEGIIERVEGYSPWRSPLVPVGKKDGGVRICVDFRALNKEILKETHPLPTIEILGAKLNGARYFSKLDIKDAFYQVEIHETSRFLTTFATHMGLFRFRRLVMGLSSSAEIFQRIMESVLTGLEGVFVYIDDILVYGRDKQEHDFRLSLVLQRLSEYGIKLNLAKCTWAQTEIEFLGHQISANGIAPDNRKVQALLDCVTPKSREELSSFLGLVSYVGARFVPHLAELCELLRELCRKDVVYSWKQAHEDAFEKLKREMSKLSENSFFALNRKTLLFTDASPIGLGAVLIQVDEKQQPHAVAYASKVLSKVERKLSQTEKEAYAIVWACEHFDLYLKGIKFVLMTDHAPLKVMFAPRAQKSIRIERWALRIQEYDYEINYVKGKLNVADALSRMLKGEEINAGQAGEQFIYLLTAMNTPEAIKMAELQETSKVDELVSLVQEARETGVWDEAVNRFKHCRDELAVVNGVLLRGDRIYIPSSLRERVLNLAHEGHPGMSAMKRNLGARVWWPGMQRDIEAKVAKCFSCQMVALPDPPEQMIRKTLPREPWTDLAIDLTGPFPTGDNLLVVIDFYSRFIEVAILRQTTSKEIIQALEEMFARFGYPYRLLSDNGRQFTSEEFVQYCQASGIELLHSMPYWPRQNGECERQMRIIKKAITISLVEGSDWRAELQKTLRVHRNTPHSTTGVAPAELLLNRKIRDKIPRINYDSIIDKFELNDKDAAAKGKGKEYGDARVGARKSTLEVGDSVLLKNMTRSSKLQPRFEAKVWKIDEKEGPRLKVKDAQGRILERNVAHVKKVLNKEDEVLTVREMDISDSEEEQIGDMVMDEEIPLSINHGGVSVEQQADRIQEESSPHINIQEPSISNFTPQVASTPLQPPTRRYPARSRRPPCWMEDFIQDEG